MSENKPRSIKRLVVEMYADVHHEIKKKACNQSMSMKQWIMEAIVDKIRKDTELGFE